MMLGKRKLQNKTVSQKYNALKDLEKGLSNIEVAAKYGVPKNTLSTWVKNKHILVKYKNAYYETIRIYLLVHFRKVQTLPSIPRGDTIDHIPTANRGQQFQTSHGKLNNLKKQSCLPKV